MKRNFSRLFSTGIMLVFLSGVFCSELMVPPSETEHSSMDHSGMASMVHCCASVSAVVLTANLGKEIPQAPKTFNPLNPVVVIMTGVKTSIFRPPKTA